MKKLTIGVDVDEVCADLIGEWLRRYNAAYGDTLTPEQVRGWDMVPNVKPECGRRIYEFLGAPGFYEHVEPIVGAAWACEELRRLGHRVVFVSACGVSTMDQKCAWLARHGFLPKGLHSQPDFIACADKALVNVDVLFDDRISTCEAHPNLGVVVTVPHNAEELTTCPRVDGLVCAPAFINKLTARP